MKTMHLEQPAHQRGHQETLLPLNPFAPPWVLFAHLPPTSPEATPSPLT